MYLNPYISGAITAIVYLSTCHLLPKKITGIKRIVIAIGVAVSVLLIIRLIIDFLFGWIMSS